MNPRKTDINNVRVAVLKTEARNPQSRLSTLPLDILCAYIDIMVAPPRPRKVTTMFTSNTVDLLYSLALPKQSIDIWIPGTGQVYQLHKEEGGDHVPASKVFEESDMCMLCVGSGRWKFSEFHLLFIPSGDGTGSSYKAYFKTHPVFVAFCGGDADEQAAFLMKYSQYISGYADLTTCDDLPSLGLALHRVAEETAAREAAQAAADTIAAATTTTAIDSYTARFTRFFSDVARDVVYTADLLRSLGDDDYDATPAAAAEPPSR